MLETMVVVELNRVEVGSRVLCVKNGLLCCSFSIDGDGGEVTVA